MIGRTIGHYRITDKLGEGGMGTVWKAEDTTLGRLVALKFLATSLKDSGTSQERMKNEARAAAAIDHQNVGVVHEVGETDEGQLFIAMAYYGKGSLRELLSRRQFGIKEVVEIGTRLAAGLSAAHQQGILHRDIKPANVMLAEDGSPKLVDFGLAKIRELSLTESGTTMGTILYASPEQIRGERVDERSDIWSLGVLLYELLTGETPFLADNEAAVLHRILESDPPLPGSVRDGVPDRLDQILARALVKERKARYQTADDLKSDLTSLLSELQSGSKTPSLLRRIRASLRKPRYAVPTAVLGVGLLAVIGTAGWRRYQAWRLENKDLPRLEEALDAKDLGTAYLIGAELDERYPDNPILERQKPRYAWPVAWDTRPSGAEFFVRPYSTPETESSWIHVGTSPMDRAWIPNDSVVHIRVEHPECEPFELVELVGIGVLDQEPDDDFEISRSYQAGIIPLPRGGIGRPGMVVVKRRKGITAEFNNWRMPGSMLGPEYLMDRNEVSNREYGEFVAAGGYEKRDYWTEPFIEDDHALSWEEAIQRFRDTTERPGPSTWSGGTYPEGRADYPVGGISWYEAVAYANYRGLKLPTIYHWRGACVSDITEDRSWTSIARAGNFDKTDSVPRGATSSVGPFGLRDMAGNVREWCWNTTTDKRFMLGGSFGDEFYTYMVAQTVSPFDRSANNGFRCADYLDWNPELIAQAESELVPIEQVADIPAPCSDEVFQVYSDSYRYGDTIPLAPEIIEQDSTRYWIMEKVTYRAAYNGDRVLAYLFLPRNVTPPYQTLVYWGGSEAKLNTSSERHFPRGTTRFLIERGRAMLCPVYLGTYERMEGHREPSHTDPALVDHYKKMIQDLRRSIDYLLQRPDIDSEKIGYVGFSWGAATPGVISLAVENRLKVAVFFDGGLFDRPWTPEISAVNYAPRVRIPLLMINGRYDTVHWYEVHQRPLFDCIGTREGMKDWKTYEGGHVIIATHRNDVIRDTTDWLDRWLGPVFR